MRGLVTMTGRRTTASPSSRLLARGAGAVAVAVALILAGGLLSPAASAAPADPPSWTCGFSNGLERENPPAQLRAGIASLFGVKVKVGPGPIDWMQFDNFTTRLYLQSLKWVEPLITSGNPDDLLLAQRFVDDWARANPPSNPADDYGWTEHAVGMRATTLACMRVSISDDPLLNTAIADHIVWLKDPARYAGKWNHGLVQDVGLIAAACVVGDDSGVAVARQRTVEALPVVVDQQGATNEQAPGYAGYVYYILNEMRAALTECSSAPIPADFARVDLMPLFMAHAVRPDGRWETLGDTSGGPSRTGIGTPLEYAASLGARGTPPKSRFGVFSAGYVFARSGWGTKRPFTAESFWSLRFGPGRIIHGHNDHTAVTTFARGRPLLVDSGFSGYGSGALRDYLRSPSAHNMTVIPGGRYRWDAFTSLVEERSTANDETFSVVDVPYSGVTRKRTVFAAHDIPLTLVVDRSTASRSQTWDQLWHMHPDLRRVGGSAYGARFQTSNNVTALSISSIPWPGRARAGITTVSGLLNPHMGWFGEGGAARPAPVTRFRTTGSDQLQIALSIASRPGAKVSWSMAPYGRTVSKLTVRIDGKAVVLLISSGSGWITRL